MHIIWYEVTWKYTKGVYISKYVIIFWKTCGCFYYIVTFLFSYPWISYMYVHWVIYSHEDKFCYSLKPPTWSILQSTLQYVWTKAGSGKLLIGLMPWFFSVCGLSELFLSPALWVAVGRSFLHTMPCRSLSTADWSIFSALVLWASLLPMCFWHGSDMNRKQVSSYSLLIKKHYSSSHATLWLINNLQWPARFQN